MQAIGLILIVIGFLAGSLVAVLDVDVIDWALFVPCLVTGVVGVILVQIAIRRRATDAGRLASNAEALTRSLEQIVAGLSALDSEKESLDPYDLPERIDATFRDDINAFVDARESIGHIWGLRAYGDIMSHFAAAERYLNRVWSAAADGYIDEATTYIGRSHEQFSEALRKLSALNAERKSA